MIFDMRRDMVTEYRAWLKDLLEILNIVCEDVVPVGRLDEGIYWRTKGLHESAKQLGGETERELISLLTGYARDGRKLLDQVNAELLVAGRESSCQSEESRIYLRRKYAGGILNSLQMLVNFGYLAEEYLNCPSEMLDEIFELEAVCDIWRVRSGSLVSGKCRNNKVESIAYKGEEGYIWNVPAAG